MRASKPRTSFGQFARATARVSGRPVAFGLATFVVLLWLVTGPLFGFSDTWQIVINTSTTIVTFLMVFLIQNTQNRDAEAVQVKLDELLRVTRGAHVALLDLEELEEDELNMIRARYATLAKRARVRLRSGEADTDVPELEGDA